MPMQLNITEKDLHGQFFVFFFFFFFFFFYIYDVSRREILNGQFLDWIKHTDPRCRSQEKEGGKREGWIVER